MKSQSLHPVFVNAQRIFPLSPCREPEQVWTELQRVHIVVRACIAHASLMFKKQVQIKAGLQRQCTKTADLHNICVFNPKARTCLKSFPFPCQENPAHSHARRSLQASFSQSSSWVRLGVGPITIHSKNRICRWFSLSLSLFLYMLYTGKRYHHSTLHTITVTITVSGP